MRTGEIIMPKLISGVTVYTLLEVAARLGVSTRTVRSYLKTGRLKGTKWGRSWHISEQNLRDFVNGENVRD